MPMTELAILRGEEDPATETGDLGREIHRRPDAAEVHIAHARLDVIAARAHLLEAERLQLDRLGPAAGDRIHPDLGEALALELPDLMALLGLDDVREPGRPSARRQATLETCGAARRRDRRRR